MSTLANRSDARIGCFARARWRIAALMIAAGLVVGMSFASAYNLPILWTYNGTDYNTKADALAAMWAAGGWSAVLTKPLPPSAMSHYGITYPYAAPPQSPTPTAWSFQVTTPGGTTSYSSEDDAAAALDSYYVGAYSNACGSASVSPSGDWTYNQPGSPPPYGSNDDYKLYTVSYPNYDDAGGPPVPM